MFYKNESKTLMQLPEPLLLFKANDDYRTDKKELSTALASKLQQIIAMRCMPDDGSAPGHTVVAFTSSAHAFSGNGNSSSVSPTITFVCYLHGLIGISAVL